MLLCDWCRKDFPGPSLAGPYSGVGMRQTAMRSYLCGLCGGSSSSSSSSSYYSCSTGDRALQFPPGTIVAGPTDASVATVERGWFTSAGEEQCEVRLFGSTNGTNLATFSASELRRLDFESFVHSSEDELSFNSHSSGSSDEGSGSGSPVELDDRESGGLGRPASSAAVAHHSDGARIFPPFDLESMEEADAVLQAWSEVQALPSNERSMLKALAAIRRVDSASVELAGVSAAVHEVFARLSALLGNAELTDQVLAATSRTVLQALVGFGEAREGRRQQQQHATVSGDPSVLWEPVPLSTHVSSDLRARDVSLREEYERLRASARDLSARRSEMLRDIVGEGTSLW
jgi:hypothetical protein